MFVMKQIFNMCLNSSQTSHTFAPYLLFQTPTSTVQPKWEVGADNKDPHLHCPAQVGGGGWTVEVGVFVISPHLPLGLDSGGGGLEKKVGCEGV